MEFYSTNRRVPDVKLGQALLEGQAADKGLFLPRAFPTFTRDELLALQGKSYSETAAAVLQPYTEGMISPEQLRTLCDDAYDYEVPLERVTSRQYVLRLDRGPTASFKDFAARMMARWMSVLMEKEQGDLVILTATSGDTGSAVAHAYHNLNRMHAVVLFPVDEVSDRQRRQMTTLDGNIRMIGIEGKFDDGQAMVKRAFTDPTLKGIRLTSANSINIGRLLPQAVYYVYAYLRLADVAAGEPVVFCVPSGNFGDMMGGQIAARMGIPIEQFVIATNANDEVPRFLETGTYEPISPSRVCLSNAMNVGHPSNLARLVDLFGGWMDETGGILEAPDMDRLREVVTAISVDDDWTRRTINEVHAAHGVVLEPHGAVGWAGLQHYLSSAKVDSNRICISLETAHPAKFPEEIVANLGINPEVPLSLAGLDDKPEEYSVIPPDYDRFRDILLASYS